ncbi:DUF4089 domain-containing protein [Acidisoma cladoniae]|jgi:hypothetical protein|uniref:DUF4089 domain-containing protein n=1 Tax=Acidisoma cladoniae TaxID=3040935 RepID=UPI00254DFC8A|nr:DUF4089 domain-containing protein [Acidisoma sp. PAMC 29798]
MADGTSSTEAYVRSAAELLDLGLDEAETMRVIAAFALVARFAQPALDWPVGPETETAPIFRL